MRTKQRPLCASHQLVRPVWLAASAGMRSIAKSASIRKASSGFNIRKTAQTSGAPCRNDQRASEERDQVETKEKEQPGADRKDKTLHAIPREETRAEPERDEHRRQGQGAPVHSEQSRIGVPNE